MATPFERQKRKSESGTWGSIRQLVKENSIPTPPGSGERALAPGRRYSCRPQRRRLLFKGFWDPPKAPIRGFPMRRRAARSKAWRVSGFSGVHRSRAGRCSQTRDISYRRQVAPAAYASRRFPSPGPVSRCDRRYVEPSRLAVDGETGSFPHLIVPAHFPGRLK